MTVKAGGPKWPYLVMIVGAPLPHILVGFVRKFPQHRGLIIQGAIGSTALAVFARMALMHDAGYAAKADSLQGDRKSRRHD